MGQQQVVLFHSALGLRPAVSAFAERLRAAGHKVVTPDSFDGESFTDMDAGARKRDGLGIPELINRAQAAVAELPAGLVYAGFSMGAAAAELLAATRPGAKAAILMHGALAPESFGVERWPSVPVQLHYAKNDPLVDPAEVLAFQAAVQKAGALLETQVYEKGGHLFEDRDLPEFDADSARLMEERVLTFLQRL